MQVQSFFAWEVNPGSEQDLNGFRSLEYWPVGCETLYNTVPQRDRALILVKRMELLDQECITFMAERRISVSFAVRRHWVTEELKNTHKSAVQLFLLWNVCNVLVYLQGVQKSPYTRTHSEILIPLISSSVYKIQSTRRWQKIQSIRWQKQFAQLPFLFYKPH